MEMRGNKKFWLDALTAGGLLLACCGMAAAQGSQGSQSGQGGQSQPPAQSTDKPKTPDVTPLTLDSAPPPVNAEEDAAFKAFQAVPNTDLTKKIELGEGLIKKYPQSRYLPPVYYTLTIAYMQTNQTDKMLEVGDKEVALQPNDVATLAILAQTISRVTNSSTPNAAQQLSKAVAYAKKAIEIAPTLPKPENMTEEAFTAGKNQALVAAHSGLGLVLIKHGQNAEAIPEMEQAIKLDRDPDPVNYYLLGMANKGTSHFDDAVAAFSKCAAATGPMQNTCKTQADDAKKKSATELSAPK
jgi:tetratricopeptide (TPR) repeat protein